MPLRQREGRVGLADIVPELPNDAKFLCNGELPKTSIFGCIHPPRGPVWIHLNTPQQRLVGTTLEADIETLVSEGAKKRDEWDRRGHYLRIPQELS